MDIPFLQPICDSMDLTRGFVEDTYGDFHRAIVRQVSKRTTEMTSALICATVWDKVTPVHSELGAVECYVFIL